MSDSEAAGIDPWFAASPVPMFETQLPALAEVLRAIRKRIGVTDQVSLLTANEIAAIRAAHINVPLVRANAAFCDYLQAPADELFAHWPSINAGALRTACDEAHLRALISAQPSASWTAEWTMADGALRAAKVVSAPLPGHERDLMAVANTLMDVTEHRRDARLLFEDNPTPTIEIDMTVVEAHLMQAVAAGLRGAEFRAAIDAAHDHQKFLRANPAALRLLQRDPADLTRAYVATVFNPEMRRAAVDAM